jgi:uncharacterized membrane protein
MRPVLVRALCASVSLPGIVFASAALAAGAATKGKTDPWVERGRYGVAIGGCNDCYTPGFAENGGKADEKVLLTGDGLGWRGPWGTTYPVNLRIFMQKRTEQEWVAYARKVQARPPMPFWALNRMRTGDLRAVYRHVRSLGPGGRPAPDLVPPGTDPRPPYVQFPAPPK